MASKPQPERLIQNEIVNFLNIKGLFCWSNKNGATYDPRTKAYRANSTLKGISDILGLTPKTGTFVAIEVKTKTGRVSKEQKIFLEGIRQSGGIAFVARSIDDVIAQMHDLEIG